jgi:hypothetical protein
MTWAEIELASPCEKFAHGYVPHYHHTEVGMIFKTCYNCGVWFAATLAGRNDDWEFGPTADVVRGLVAIRLVMEA